MEEIISSSAIKNRNKELANEISEYYKDKELIVLGVLKGCIYFLSDITKLINQDISIELISVNSYAGQERGDLSFNFKTDFNIEGKNILIVEDIIDTGNTINFLFNKIKEYNPKEIKIVSFLFKPTIYKFNISIDWVGFEIENDFVVGYGLDYNGKFRNKESLFRICN